MILTADGRWHDEDRRVKVRNGIHCVPVRESPRAKAERLCTEQPIRYNRRLPRMSARDPREAVCSHTSATGWIEAYFRQSDHR